MAVQLVLSLVVTKAESSVALWDSLVEMKAEQKAWKLAAHLDDLLVAGSAEMKALN